jgi:hypothetical protein
MSRNQRLVRYGRCSCDLYSACSVWFPFISTQLSALRRTEVRTLSKISGFNRIPWHAFSVPCCSTSKSMIGAEYTKIFTCPHSQSSGGLRSGDRAGQLTWLLRPVQCSPKVWFRFCLTMRTNEVVPHHAWTTCGVVDEEIHVPSVLANHSLNWEYTVPVSLSGETTDPKNL